MQQLSNGSGSGRTKIEYDDRVSERLAQHRLKPAGVKTACGTGAAEHDHGQRMPCLGSAPTGKSRGSIAIFRITERSHFQRQSTSEDPLQEDEPAQAPEKDSPAAPLAG